MILLISLNYRDYPKELMHDKDTQKIVMPGIQTKKKKKEKTEKYNNNLKFC